MCGRYVAVADEEDLLEEYHAARAIGSQPTPSFNVAPTDQVPVVLERAHEGEPAERQVRTLRWGLVPHWAKDLKIGSQLINARVESLAQKPAFRDAFRRHRCIVPAAGYYEWEQVEEGGKVRKKPYFIYREDGHPLAFAGLYAAWRNPEADEDDPERWLRTFTIITTTATGPEGEIHDRTPLILPADRIDAWLDPSLTDPQAAQRILAGVDLPVLEIRPVSTAVNSVRNNGPELIEPVDASADWALQLQLS